MSSKDNESAAFHIILKSFYRIFSHLIPRHTKNNKIETKLNSDNSFVSILTSKET